MFLWPGNDKVPPLLCHLCYRADLVVSLIGSHIKYQDQMANNSYILSILNMNGEYFSFSLSKQPHQP